MGRLREAIRQKLTDLWKNQSWILHQNNAPGHTSIRECEFLAKIKTVIMPQPPHAPDLAPADFFLFPKLKAPMKGKCFATIEEIKKSKQELMMMMSFRSVFKIGKTRRHKCIISDGGGGVFNLKRTC